MVIVELCQLPSEQISIGGLGNLDTNGNLWVTLPDNDPLVVTPMLAGFMNYLFSPPVATKYTPVIVVNSSVTLDPDSVTNGADFCVGQSLAFDVTGLPSPVYDVKAVWTLAGTLVNTHSDPNCNLYYEKNAALLSPPTGTTGTRCW